MLIETVNALCVERDGVVVELFELNEKEFSALLGKRNIDPIFLIRDLRNETTEIERASEIRSGSVIADDVLDLIKKSECSDDD